MFHVKQGKYHKIIHGLHEKYGPVVRIAPNVLSLNFPGSIKIIYNTKGNYRKVSIELVYNYCFPINLGQTEFYHGSSAKGNDGTTIFNLFSEDDSEKHHEQKRPIGKYYSMTNARRHEPHIDEVIDHLCCQWEKRFMGNLETFDLAEWFSLCESPALNTSMPANNGLSCRCLGCGI